MPHWIAKQCLLFVLSGICSSGAPTQPHPGSYRERLVLKLPRANYNAEWIEPESGSVTASENFMLGSEKQVADFSRLLHRCGA